GYSVSNSGKWHVPKKKSHILEKKHSSGSPHDVSCSTFSISKMGISYSLVISRNETATNPGQFTIEKGVKKIFKSGMPNAEKVSPMDLWSSQDIATTKNYHSQKPSLGAPRQGLQSHFGALGNRHMAALRKSLLQWKLRYRTIARVKSHQLEHARWWKHGFSYVTETPILGSTLVLDRNLQTLYHNIAVLWHHSFYHVTTRSVSKMADINVSFRQRAVIEFLVKEEHSAVDIHQRLQCAYRDACM
ncbi:hypothetical protein L9F63_007763, partial [Diploptera punctata]